MKVGFISLGCSKNLVDTEMTIGLFKEKKFTIVNNPKEAEIIVINTCGFIEAAKEEAIQTILEMAEYKEENCKYLIVMGCLVQRYKKELEKNLPEVDLFISIDEYADIWDKIETLINKTEKYNSKNTLEYSNRIITTGGTTAYLKIAEGCSNRCTYCAIPYIRGSYQSRPLDEVIEEAKRLAQQGFKELIVIAQDTTKYGIDLYGEGKLPELLKSLEKIEGIKWIRFLYAYPESITEELIQTVKQSKKICHYFDIPIQHISNKVLMRMNRKSNGESIKKLLKHIREEIPDVILRTSLIVGFPGENEEDFQELYEFVNSAKFNKLGVFAYSKEDGTPAEKLPNQIHPMTKKKRYNEIMKIQQKISGEKLTECIGKEYEILIEGKTFDNEYYIGRTYMDVPDMDGVVYLKNTKEYSVGEFVNGKIIEVKEYDLVGEIIWTKKEMKN